MGYWSATSPLLINQNVYNEILGDEPICILDGGSTNDLFEPIDSVYRNAEIVAFDPSPASINYGSRLPIVNVNFALWNGSERVPLHVARSETTSSVYPPNKPLLEMFNDRIGWHARETLSQIEVPAISIDEAVEHGYCRPPDIIKLDIHSAEYEALDGARKTLETACAVLVETWHHPVHNGQQLHGAVEKLLNESGFLLYDMKKASTWRPLWRGQELRGRRIMVGSESLFMREDPASRLMPKTIIVLDMFAYYASALNMSSKALNLGLISESSFIEIKRLLVKKAGSYEGNRINRIAKTILKRIAQQL